MKAKKLGKKSVIILMMLLLVASVAASIITSKKIETKFFSAVEAELAVSREYEQFVDGDEKVDGTDNVEFSAFFLRDLDGDGYAEKIKGTCREIGKKDTLYMEINVLSEGMLKNGKIQIVGKNFNLATALPRDAQIKNNAIGSNIEIIEFNNLINGTQKLLTGVINFSSVSNINNYSINDNKIILTGTYVSESGVEKEIRKEILLTVDWHGTVRTLIVNADEVYYGIDKYVNEENGTIDLSFEVGTQEINEMLVLGKNHVEIEIPNFNGYKPDNVMVTSTNVNYNYDKNSQLLVIERNANISDNGYIRTSVAKNNTYEIKVRYPIEAFNEMYSESVDLLVPIEEYYEGFNNPSSEFVNPYKSNIAKDIIKVTYYKDEPAGGEFWPDRFSVSIGEYISKPYSNCIISKEKPMRIYDGMSSEEHDDNYVVSWFYFRGNIGEDEKIVLKEDSNDVLKKVDNFLNSSGTYSSMEGMTTNKGIYFSDLLNVLEDDGEIKVYDDQSDNLLLTINNTNYKQYSARPFYYNLPVDHIRVEIIGMKKVHSLYVYNIKELDDDYITNYYTKEEFEELKKIRTTLAVLIENEIKGVESKEALYALPISVAKISISKNIISTQEIELNDLIKIKAEYISSMNEIGWTNGVFLIKMPDEVLETEINSISIDNSNVTISSYEYYENEDGNFIKIYTSNNKPQAFEITIDANLIADPRIPSTNKSIELYAVNQEESDYYYYERDLYDIDLNGNKTENVNFSNCGISMIAPNSLLTNQILKEFDENGTVIVSPDVADIAPKIVGVDNNEKTAKIGIQIKNNYSSDIDEIVIVGKIPFEGNTSVLTGRDLGSNYTTRMLDTGIEVPESLQGKVDVYYSTNENPNKDLLDESNRWVKAEDVTDWSAIRTFLIDFNNTDLNPTEEYIFYYKVAIPNGINYNKVSYSHHGIWFSLNTAQGKYRTRVEPTKTGLRIAEKYGLELTKYQTGKDKTIGGATYKISAVNNDGSYGNVKTGMTFENGKLTITGLYIEQKYEIKEIKSPNKYELNEDAIVFICHIDENGDIQAEKISGNIRGEINVIRESEENEKIIVNVEDEVKANLKIIKTEKDTENKLYRIKYKLLGYGLPENGRVLTTNINGEAIINGLRIGEVYTLEEIRAEGYYINEPITFIINNNSGEYEVNVNGSYKKVEVLLDDDIPTAVVELEDEKIPKYNIQINKIEKGSNTEENPNGIPVVGAKFNLYKNDIKIGQYVSDSQGKINIENLCVYDERWNIDQTYRLVEVYAPEGYSKISDVIFYAKKIDKEISVTNSETGETTTETVKELKLEQILEENQVAKDYIVNENTIIITLEDLPSFRLIKKDGETNELLPNTKFAIFNIDEETLPARNSKGEIIGTKEIIDGYEYYTVTTDENGQITADLPEGLYKVIELESDIKYDISSNIEYFGIGKAVESRKEYAIDWIKTINGSDDDNMFCVKKTSDNGYIIRGDFRSDSLTMGDIELFTHGYSDMMIIKCDSEGEVEWADAIGGTSTEWSNEIIETSDGGFLYGGYSESAIVIAGGEEYTNTNSRQGILIKYNNIGEVEWFKSIGDSGEERVQVITELEEGGYLVGGYFTSSRIAIDGRILINHNSGNRDIMLIKYNSEGEVEWADSIGGDVNDNIAGLFATSDGGYLLEGQVSNGDITIGDITVGDPTHNNSSAFIIKYLNNGEIEWVDTIRGRAVFSRYMMKESSNGDYLLGGYFDGSSIIVGNETINNVGKENNGRIEYGYNVFLVKYNNSGNVKWYDSFGGENDDFCSSLTETEDGGYMIGGYFNSPSLTLGDKTLNNLNMNYPDDEGYIAKINSEGEVEWARILGLSDDDCINSVIETDDGGYLAGGYFHWAGSSVIRFTIEGRDIYNYGGNDGILIKYKLVDIVEPKIEWAESIGNSNSDVINSMLETSDGGAIAVGTFSSESLSIGEETLINQGSSNGLIIKYGRNGNVEWAKSIGGTSSISTRIVIETKDGGFLVGGSYWNTLTIGEKSITAKGAGDGFLIKFSKNGDVEWLDSLGGTSSDNVYSIFETKDGGYLIGGGYQSSNFKIGEIGLPVSGNMDGFFAKYSINGEVEWAERIGSNGNDCINSAIETSEGGYLLGGHFTNSITLGEETLTSQREKDGLIIKLNRLREVEWAKRFGDTGDDTANSVIEIKEGDYVVGGDYRDWDTSVGRYNLQGRIIRYSNNGEEKWVERINGYLQDSITTLKATKDGGFLAGGYFQSTDLRVGRKELSTKGGYDGLIVKYNYKNEVEWAEGIGGTSDDIITSGDYTKDGNYLIGGYFQSNDLSIGGTRLTNYGNNDGMLLKIYPNIGCPEQEELVYENYRKEYNITTDINEIDNIKGGTISGEDLKSYETVKYGDNNLKDIVIEPDENYKIISITVNGEEFLFDVDENDNYIMPQFTNIIEDKHIVVTFAKKDNMITLNKVDSITNEKISGVNFRLDQIEERTDPNSEEIIGNLIDNGETYTNYSFDDSNEIQNVIGEMVANGTYYFVNNDDNKLIPTNGKTYQLANGGTSGIQNSIANSYIPIDLTDMDGSYAVVINAQVSSENNYDYGYATINESMTAPTYSNTSGRIMCIAGTIGAKDYSMLLQGGKKYYLHLGYRKDGSSDINQDQIIFNSVKVYSATLNDVSYGFIENEGIYESTNQGEPNTVCNSYIPINLEGYTGKYNLIVNAQISSESSYDYGYATITETTNRVDYNDSNGRFIYISGTVSAKDYNIILDGGKTYYLQLGYRKNNTNNYNSDKFTINSIRIALSDVDLYHIEVETNLDGQAITQIPFGKYQVTETNTTEEYWLLEEPVEIEFRSNEGAQHEFTIENEAKAKVIVHHYLKDDTGNYTETKLAEDEIIYGHIDDSYNTYPLIDLDKYELEKDIDGIEVIPSNSSGSFTRENIEVNYYYEQKLIPLIVHHYIEGTETPVLLIDGTNAEDEILSGRENDEYETQPIEDSRLDERYVLSQIPDNASGRYEYDNKEVIYYYKLVQSNVIINKKDEEGTNSLKGAKFIIDTDNTSNIVDIGEMTSNGQYYFVETDGKYISNNTGKQGTTANSYIRVDTTNAREAVRVKINVIVSSESSCDIGYITINENQNAPAYNITTGRIVSISGTGGTARDYEKELEPGSIYYIHFGYRKDGSVNKGNDNFIINSIEFENIPDTIYTTNDNGRIETILESGTYYITEVVAPEGYVVSDNSTQEIIVNKDVGDIELNINNERANGSVIVKHYLENTTTSIADDVSIIGKIGETYYTEPIYDLPDDMVIVDEYPNNYMGEFINGTIEVIYYYRIIPRSYEVHYYYDGIENTSKTEYLEARKGTEITDYPNKILTGYKLDRTENLPLIVSDDISSNIINVYYVKDTYNYSIHYYYDGVEDVNEVVNGSGLYQDVIENYPEKPRDHYSFDRVTNSPLTITENENNNKINVYYISDKYEYSIHYYYDGVEDVSKVETGNAKYGDEISTYIDKVIEHYMLDRTENLPLVISDNVNNNIINIYYEGVKTTYSVNKTWDLLDDSEIDNYRATFLLKKIVGGVATNALDDNGDEITRQITGNGYVVFDNIPEYEGNSYIEYSAEEIKIEKTTDGGTTWTEISPLRFETEYSENNGNNNNSNTNEEIEIGINDGVFKSYNGDNNLFGISMTKEDILSFSRNTELTRDEVLAKSGVTRIDNTAEGQYHSNKEIYGWIEDDKFYWWSEAEQVYFHPNTTNAFRNYYNCTTIDLTGTNSSLVVSFNNWFRQDNYSDTKFTTLIGALDTRSATDMAYMFYDCNKLTAIDTSKFNTSKVTTMDRMFGTLRSIESLDVSMFDTSNVTNMYWMFRYCNAEELDLSSFDTSKVTNMQGMFVSSLYRLKTIKLGPNFNTANVTNMADMFNGCTKLTTIYAVNDFDTTKVTNSSNMFNNDTLLVGAAGTSYSTPYDSGKKDKTYARIATETQRGYFTYYEPEEINTVSVTNTEKNTINYTIYYKEQGTNVELSTAKTVDGVSVGDTITETAIDITGYDKVNPTSTEIEIIDGTNEYTFYYTKKTTLGYTIHYKEQGTENTLATDKVVTGKTFGDKFDESAIDITGYDKVNPTSTEIEIIDGTNEYTFYYTKKTNLGYTIHYKEQGTETTLAPDKVVTGKTFGDTFTETAINIAGYNKVAPTSTEIEIIDGTNEYTFYYTKRTDLVYRVEYYYDNEIDNSKTEANIPATYNQEITTYTDKIIDGYKFSKVEPTLLTISENNEENVIRVYYVRDSYGYSVEYYYDNVIDNDKTERSSALFNDVIRTYTDKIIHGYELVEERDLPLTITSDATRNIIRIFYEKVKGLIYRVNYLEKGTNEVIHDYKEVGNKTFGDVINAIDEKITIPGYNYDSADKNSISIDTDNDLNVINLYYTKKNNLGYIIHYKEQGTEATLAPDKVETGKIFKDKFTENAIDITGYDKVAPISIEIEVLDGTNEYTFYYTKRTNLSYIVHYREQGIETEVSPDKVVGSQVFGDKITESAIDVNGYDKVNPTSAEIEITTGTNEYTFYYTKKTNLGYTIHYKEQGTEETLSPDKVVSDKTFKDKFTENAIDIDGYDKVAPISTEIEVLDGVNEYTFYYTKKTTLSYTIHYKEQGTEEILAPDKVENGKTFGDKFDEDAIDITGYDKVVPISTEIEVLDGVNEYTFYYTKKNNLSYTIYYKEQGTEDTLAEAKFVTGKTYKDKFTENAIDITGYDKVDPTSTEIEVLDGVNEYTFYYTKKTNLSYTVHYREQGTETEVSPDKVVGSQVFGDKITENAIDVAGYNKVSSISAEIEITAGTNEYTFYYTKKTTLSYTIHYREQGTEATLASDKVETGKTFKDKFTETAIDISGYDKVEPISTEIEVLDGVNEYTFYYIKKTTLSYTIHYKEQGTEETLAPDKVETGKTFKDKFTENAIDISGYNKIDPTSTEIEVLDGVNEYTFYYIKKDMLGYIIYYKEQGTEKVIADPKVETGKTFGDKIDESAIDIAGYDKVNPISTEIEVLDGVNEYTFYYTKRTNLSYIVHYREQGTEAEVSPDKVVGSQVFGDKITENAIDVNGYDKVNPTSAEIEITVGTNEYTFYYTKRTNLSYIVHYREQGTEAEVSPDKVVGSQVFGDKIIENAIGIAGYNKVEPITAEIEITTGTNEYTFYYTKRTDLVYRVEYYYDNEIDNSKTEANIPATYNQEITTYTDKIIDGYKFSKVEPTLLTISEINDDNVIRVYYVRETYGYSVEYYYDNVIDNDKTENSTALFNDVIRTYTDKVIHGYELIEERNLPLTITSDTTRNIIKIFYEKVKGLIYRVNYLEKGTNEVIHNYKEVGNKTFGDVINTADEIITIPGYNYDSADKNSLSIDTENSLNVINLYYTKKTNLSYTIYYKEQGTGNVLADPKVETGKTFKDKFTENAIDIDGYDKVNPITIEIEVLDGVNEYTFYYTKRTNLSYTVHYREQGTELEVYPDKTVGTQTFGEKITENAVDVAGYNKVAPTSTEIEITTGTNEYTFYYTKKNNLGYTIYYKEQGTDTELSDAKVVTNKTYKDKFTETAIDISGYDKVNPTSTEIEVLDGVNEYTFYYTKKNNLSYTIHYKEQGTGKTLADDKVETGKTFKDKFTENAIDISGYNKIDPTSTEIEVLDGVNEYTFYYIKKDTLGYIIYYKEQGTEKVIADPKVETGKTFGDKFDESAIDIAGYDKVNPTSTEIEVLDGVNEYTFYYTKRTNLSYTVHYKEQGSELEVSPDKVVGSQVFGDKITENAINVNGYDKVNPTSAEIEITAGTNEYTFYYTKRTNLSYTVHYREQGTEKEVYPDKIVGTQTFGDKITENAVDVNGYDKVAPISAEIEITTGTNEYTFYYTKRSNLSYKVNYLEKGTDKVLSTQKEQNGMTFGTEIVSSTEVIGIKGYNYNSVDKDVLVIGTGENVINIYYEKKALAYRVEYYYDSVIDNSLTEPGVALYEDKITEYVDKVKPGYVFDRVETIPFTITDNVDNNVIKVYYKYIDVKVTVKYVDIITREEIETREVIPGHINKPYETVQKDISGYMYDSYEGQKAGTMGAEDSEVTYYYIKTSDLKIKYVDINTGEPIHDPKEYTGKENEQYDHTSDILQINNYTLVDDITEIKGTFTREDKEIVIHYAKNTNVIAKYYDLNNEGQEIALEERIDGYVGKEYQTTQKEIRDYVFIKDSGNTSGPMTEEPIVVKYYYSKVAKVIVHHYILNTTTPVNLPDGNPAQDVEITGYIGKDYRTEQVTPENTYKFVNVVGDTVGTMQEEQTVITYYYAQKANIIVYYIDLDRNEEITRVTYEGYDGERYDLEEKVFDKYYLESKPDIERVVLQGGETLEEYYYYRRVIRGLIVKHTDIISDELLLNEYEEKEIGAPYTSNFKEFEGYVPVTNEQYIMRFGSIPTGEEPIQEPINGDTENTIDNTISNTVTNEVINTTTNTIENTIENTITNSLENIIENSVTTHGSRPVRYGMVSRGDTRTGDITVDLTALYIPYNKAGVIDKQIVEVNYYYIKKARVIVNYIDNITGTTIKVKDGNNLVDTTEIIDGFENSDYRTTSKDIEGYIIDTTKLPEKPSGTMPAGDTVINYYYNKVSNVIVKYVDAETGEEIAQEVEFIDLIGTQYKTDAKDISEYELVETRLPINATGEIKEDTTEVVYYYVKKKPENIVNNTTNNTINNVVNNTTNDTNTTNVVNNVIENRVRNEVNNSTNTINNVQNNNVVNNIVKRSEGTSWIPNTGDKIIIGCIITVVITLVSNMVLDIIVKKRFEDDD